MITLWPSAGILNAYFQMHLWQNEASQANTILIVSDDYKPNNLSYKQRKTS